MKKNIVVSDLFHTEDMIYLKNEKRWKCTYTGFYKMGQKTLENQTFQIHVHFSEKGEVESAEKENQLFFNEIFAGIKRVETYKNHLKYCKEVIKEIENTKNNTNLTFNDFYYNFKEKEGRFCFEKSLLRYNFSFTPSEGINELYIQYRGLKWNIPRVRVKGHPCEIFGQFWADILNNMIKKELKLRFFF